MLAPSCAAGGALLLPRAPAAHHAPPGCCRPPLLQGTSAADALAALKEFQREDFEGIFTAMDGLPGEPHTLDLSFGALANMCCR